MSRWLKSVNTLLDSLDGQVETAIEEQVAHEQDDARALGQETVESILAKRGLSATNGVILEPEATREGSFGKSETDVEAKGHVDETVVDAQPVVSQSEEFDVPEEALAVESSTEPETVSEVEKPIENDENQTDQSAEPVQEIKSEVAAEDAPQVMAVVDLSIEAKEEKDANEERRGSPTMVEAVNEAASQKTPSLPRQEPAPSSPKPEASSSAAPTVNVPTQKNFEEEFKAALAEARGAQKESRTLRRHVVALNEELETAEAEIKAQRTELERAGERMEKDRTRHKEEKEVFTARHVEEIKALKAQHEQAMKEQKRLADEQLEGARKRMRAVEEQRMQEGGDWTKELEVSVQREHDAAQRMASLEDEKLTLLSQISTLQAQQAALANRVESLSQTADNALDREREADDRLDAALSMHARQLTQRQNREAELERTVTDLGAALVVARNKEVERLKSEQHAGVTSDSGDSGSSTVKLAAAEDELETVKAQLEIEKQRSQTLHEELRDQTKERTEEASALHARQLQSDRRVADMSLTISRLQATMRDTKRDSMEDNHDSSRFADGMDEQIKSLSEQVIRQQDRLGQSSTEIKAMKSRLQSALNRAEQAEAALAAFSETDSVYDSMERGPKSASMRRRGGQPRDVSGGSIRSVMNLNKPGQEKIAKAIDVVDTFSVETGKYLRYNPLARGFFLLYLVMIHLWTFALLMFHAHGYETVHGDFGAGRQLPHGPHALMHQQDPAQTP